MKSKKLNKERTEETKKTATMDILLEQESNLNTIAAISTIAVSKTDNHLITTNSRQVQTDIVKGASDALDFKRAPKIGAFDNLPPAEPLDIYFKDLSYSVQKMFSKS